MAQLEAGELLERTAETAALDDALAAAEAEGGGLVLVEGAAGLGKTSLLAVAAGRAADRGFRVLRATGDDLDTGLPWGVAVQLFGETVRDRAADRLFSGASRRARELLEGTAAPEPGADSADAFPLLHGLHWLTAGLCARRPVLLAVDDVHWCDPETLRLLAYLVPRIDELRALAVAAVRPGEAVGRAAEVLARLQAQPMSKVLSLEPLSQPAIARLVRRALPGAEEGFCQAVAAASGGNPFLARELAVAARGERLSGTAESAGRLRELQPQAIRNSILVRLARLGPDATRVASAVSVLGPGASPELTRALSGLDGDRAVQALDTLVEAEVLMPSDPLAFVHPILREVVYADLPPMRRRGDHVTTARLLHERGRPADQVASHLEAGVPVDEEWAVSALREAGAVALRRGAPERAARYLRRALEIREGGGDAELLLEAGLAELAAAEPAALGHLEAAAQGLGDARLRARALGGLARARYVRGEETAAVAAARDALAQLSPGRGGALEAVLLMDLVLAARPVPDELGALDRLLQRPRLAEDGHASPAEVVRQLALALDAFLRGDGSTARERIDAVLPLLADPALTELLPPYASGLAAFCLNYLGAFPEADALVGPELGRAWRRGNRIELAQLLELRFLAHFRRGEVSAALADSETLLSLRDEGWELATIPVRAGRAAMLLERGELELAHATLCVPEDIIAERLPGTWASLRLPWGRAVLAAADGDWAGSLEQAVLAGERAAEIEAHSPDWIPWRSLAARAAARLGDRERAESLARGELALARAAGSPRATGVALGALAAVADGPEAVATLEEAIAELDQANALLEGARARVQLGIALRHRRRPRDARRPLRKALDAARRVGATVLAEQALAELRSTGARPRRSALSGLESLTPSERRVAELVASGLSNQEVAETLFVTLRTVETHLTHAYGKLGITSRAELPAALAGEAAAPPR